MRHFVMLGTVIVIALTSPSLSRAAIITNPGFETGTTGWSLTSTGGITSFGVGNYSDSPALDANTTVAQRGLSYQRTYYGGGSFGTTTVAQTLTGQPVLANTNYVLSVDIVALSGGTQTRSLPPVVEIRLKDSLSGLELPGGTLSNPTPALDNLTTWTMKYTTGATVSGGDLRIELFTNKTTPTPSTVDQFVGFDNVALTSFVPEPATLSIAALALLALRRWK
jgi:hypothetical protein